MLHDRGGNDQQVGSDVLHHHRPRDTELEQQYRLYRQPVFAMLHSEFPGLLAEHDEIYQEAWTELLEIEARGEEIRNRRALLKTLARRRATDAVRRTRADSLDPSELILLEEPDPRPQVDEAVQVHLDADVLRLVIDTLDKRQAAVLKLRFDCGLSGPEIQELLGVSAKRFAKIMGRAYKAVLDQVEPGADGESSWSRRQRSLLLACELGIATATQRAHAQELIDRDPRCRAMLRSMRASVRDVAIALPMPPVLAEGERRGGPIGALLDHLDRASALLRHGGHEPLIARASTSPSVEQAGAGMLGGLGLGAAVKGFALCLAIGGTAAVCVDGILPQDQPRRRTPVHVVVKPRRNPPPVVVHVAAQPVTRNQSLPSATSHTTSRTTTAERAVSSPAARPPASPAPAGATEFGPGSVGSSSAAPAPAAAPTNGGGEFTP